MTVGFKHFLSLFGPSPPPHFRASFGISARTASFQKFDLEKWAQPLGDFSARLKLKGIDGRAPPGVEPAA